MDGLRYNPDFASVLSIAMSISPNPENLVGNGVTPIFSRRPN
jgi:hypothetical protein